MAKKIIFPRYQDKKKPLQEEAAGCEFAVFLSGSLL